MAIRVTIFDDNKKLLDSLNILIDGSPGFQIAGTFINCSDLVTKIEDSQPDVILMDIEMPNMNGFQVIKELRQRKNKTPVIALTAHAMPEDRLRTKNAGFFDHVTKPIDFNYLVSTIETLH